MFEKLERIEKKLAETEEKLSSPDVASDMQAYTALMKEYKQLLPVAEKYREYKKALADKEDYALFMDSADDADMKEEARAEYAAAEEACEK
ncbi:MAG: PCRF domain-containing protein, partial [Clostridia bacterium]|nr:PCRF domain-containing protein [Clostridia bacterium]